MLIRYLGSETQWQGSMKGTDSHNKTPRAENFAFTVKTLWPVTYGSPGWKPRCFRLCRWHRVVYQPACVVRMAHVACSEPRLQESCKMQQDSQKCLGLIWVLISWALQVQKSSIMVKFFSIPTFSYINHTRTVTQFKKPGSGVESTVASSAKEFSLGARDGPVIKSTSCSCRGPVFGSQHPCGGDKKGTWQQWKPVTKTGNKGNEWEWGPRARHNLQRDTPSYLQLGPTS